MLFEASASNQYLKLFLVEIIGKQLAAASKNPTLCKNDHKGEGKPRQYMFTCLKVKKLFEASASNQYLKLFLVEMIGKQLSAAFNNPALCKNNIENITIIYHIKYTG